MSAKLIATPPKAGRTDAPGKYAKVKDPRIVTTALPFLDDAAR